MNRKLIYLIFFVGLLLRFSLFIQKRDLWHDEASLLLNVKEKSFNELFKERIEYNQMVPLFFLILNKFFVILDKDKNNELIIRFLPFLFSILSFFTFYYLMREINSHPRFLFTSVTIFSISETLLLYSSEFKHYSLDFFTSSLFLLIYFKFLKNSSIKNSLLLFISCILLPFFSFTIFTFFPATFLTSLYFFLKRKSFKEIYFLIFSTLILGAFSLFYYYNFLLPYKRIESLSNYWNNFFFNPFVISEYIRFIGVFISVFHGTLGLRIPILVFLFFISGLFFLYDKDKKIFLFSLLSLLTLILLSFLKIYPFHGRLLLFFNPVLIYTVSMNYSIKNLIYKRLFYIIFSIIFFKTIFYDVKLLLYPHRIEIKKAIYELKKRSIRHAYVSGSLKIPFKIYEREIEVVEKENILKFLKNYGEIFLILDIKESKEFRGNFYISDSAKFFNVYLFKIFLKHPEGNPLPPP